MQTVTGNRKKIIDHLINQDDTKIFELKEKKKARTRTQNSYYWELLNQLAEKMRIPSNDLHIENIKKSCPCEEYLVPDESNLRGIRYYEVISKKQVKDKLFKVIRVYTGSSDLNTIEFGILLDNLIEECKEQRICVLTPNEIAQLKSMENE